MGKTGVPATILWGITVRTGIKMLTLAGLTALVACSGVSGSGPGIEEPAITADQLGFSIENMDTSADPAADFYQFAAGGWDARVALPEGAQRYSFLTITEDRLSDRLQRTVEYAAENADDAPEGSAQRQVGVLYNAFVDVEARNAAGAEPLSEALAAIEAVSSMEEMSSFLGEYSAMTNQWPIVTVEVFGDLSDSSMNATYLRPGSPGLLLDPIFEQPAGSPPKQMYADYIAALLVLAGYDEERAAQAATTSVAIETVLHEGKLEPEMRIDLRNLNNRRTRDEARAEFGSFDVAAFMEGFGGTLPDTVIVTDPDVPAAVAAAFEQFTLDDFKSYLTYRLVQRFGAVLSEEFATPAEELNLALLSMETPDVPVEQQGIQFVRAALPQPLGRVYVENFFDAEQREMTVEIIEYLQAAFRERIEENDWLSDSTRAEALEKIDSFYYEMGYPDEWIDYSGVEITDDLVASMMAIARFDVQRMVSNQGQPVDPDPFSDPGHTVPTVVNAAYSPTRNGFEVTAAIAQAPAFEPDMDAAVRFCRFGAVVGHEMTHGFDSGGREFDATGTLRNWWTDADAEHFNAQAALLVEQASAFEILPGRFINGELTVKENMADIGGLTLAHRALMNYLEENPDENVEIDGYTPSQRCFIAYTQLWAEKMTESAAEMQLAQDEHAPNRYRAIAPLYHIPAFYDAFDINEGDPMWLAPERRVVAW